MSADQNNWTVTPRAMLLLALTAALLLGWQRLAGTVTSVRGSYPLADAGFIRGVAEAFSGR